jgi:hypothetical protein
MYGALLLRHLFTQKQKINRKLQNMYTEEVNINVLNKRISVHLFTITALCIFGMCTAYILPRYFQVSIIKQYG